MPDVLVATMRGEAVTPNDLVATAGAFLLYRGLFAFAVGPTPAGDGLAVFRLGGHRGPEETAAQCAVREIWEEAAVPCKLVAAPASYLLTPVPGGGHDLQPIDGGAWGPPAPLLVAQKVDAQQAGARQDGSPKVSVTFLAVTPYLPTPAGEVAGILLLDEHAVRRLTSSSVTLGQFCASGGCALLQRSLDPALPLKPLAQLQILPRLLALHPDLAGR